MRYTIIALMASSSLAVAADAPRTITFETVQTYEIQKPPVGRFYTSAGVGKSGRHMTADLGFGYRFGDTFEAELDYTYKNGGEHFLIANALAGYQFDNVRPYALVGAGYRWGDNSDAVWNVGAGVKLSITENIDLDGRYRFVSDFSGNEKDQITTIGLVYRW